MLSRRVGGSSLTLYKVKSDLTHVMEDNGKIGLLLLYFVVSEAAVIN